MDILGTIKALFLGLGALCGWGKQRDAEENSKPMQENATGQTDAKIAAQSAKDELAPTGDAFDERTS